MKKKVLKNGVRLLTIPMKGTQTFSILVMVKTGSRHETKAQSGLSHFVEHMFFKGTDKRPDTLAISSALDSIGGEFNAFTSKEYTGYYAKADTRHALKAIDVIGDMLLHSKFDAAEIERERGVILEEINMYENNPLIHIDDLFERCLYGDTPAGRDTIGSAQNIRSFGRSDFIDYVASQYRGREVVVGLAGKFGRADIKGAEKYFSRLSAGQAKPAEPVVMEQSEPRLMIKKQNTKQVSFALGFPAYAYDHPDFYVLKVLAIILGGSMSSRLFISVRERHGLAYQIHTDVEGYADTGYVATVIGTSLDKLKLAIKTILHEHAVLRDTLVSVTELRRAKDYLKGKTTLQLESSENINAWYVKQELLQKKVLSPDQLFAVIDRVKAIDVRRVARAVFQPDTLNAAGIGSKIPQADIQKILSVK